MKRKHKKALLILITLLVTSVVVYHNKKVIFRQIYKLFLQARFQGVYKGIGFSLPYGYTIHGIDVSHYQGRIDWDLVQKMKIENEKLDFVFLRATMGKNRQDFLFDDNWEEAEKSGLRRGAYHFYDEGVSAQKQAENFIEAVGKLKKKDLPPVLDIEGELDNIPVLIKDLKVWLKKVEEATGKKPIIYTNSDLYYLHFKDEFKGYKFWIAHYYVFQPDVLNDKNVLFWQYHDKGRVNGVREYVDFNVFMLDSTEFNKL